MPIRPANRPAIVTSVALASVGGLVLGRFGWIVPGWYLIVGLGTTILFWRSRVWWLVLIGLSLMIGLVRADDYDESHNCRDV